MNNSPICATITWAACVFLAALTINVPAVAGDGFGACCLPTGECIETEGWWCFEFYGGEFQGDGVPCLPDTCATTGACCIAWMNDCLELTEDECLQEEGQFLGEGTACAEITCTFSCCLPSGDCMTVSHVDDCYMQGGIPFSLASCLSLDCSAYAVGACCLEDGCVIRFRGVCELQGGVFLGGGTICDPDPCVTEDTGACCIGSECLFMTEMGCSHAGGVFTVDVECTVGSCIVVEPGICCFDGSGCQAGLTIDECWAVGGDFHEDPNDEGCEAPWLDCSNDASCPEDHTSDCNGNCYPLHWAGDGACDQGNIYWGQEIDTSCPELDWDSGDCIDPAFTGACCFHMGCRDLTQKECDLSGGEYMGDLVTCDLLPCGLRLQGDLNHNYVIDIHDLLRVISGYGVCHSPESNLPCPGDATANRTVDIHDLLYVIAHWDEECPPFAFDDDQQFPLDESGTFEVPDYGDPLTPLIVVRGSLTFSVQSQVPPAGTVLGPGDHAASIEIEITDGKDVYPYTVEPSLRGIDQSSPIYSILWDPVDPDDACLFIEGDATYEVHGAIARSCTGVTPVINAEDNVDPEPAVRLWIDDDEVPLDVEITEPGFYHVHWEVTDSSENTSSGSSMLEINPIPLMEADAATTRVVCQYDESTQDYWVDIDVVLSTPKQEHTISHLQLSTAVLIPLDEFGFPLESSAEAGADVDPIRIYGSRDLDGNYTHETTNASFESGQWTMNFNSVDDFNGAEHFFSECPSYGFVHGICIDEVTGEEIEVNATFPIREIDIDSWAPYQEGNDEGEPEGGPEEETSCKCSFSAKEFYPRTWTQPHKSDLRRHPKGRQFGHYNRFWGTDAFRWSDSLDGKLKGVGGHWQYKSRQQATAGRIEVWANGPRDKCKSIFKVELTLKAEQSIFLKRIPHGTTKTYINSGGMMSAKSSMGDTLYCYNGAVSRWNWGEIEQGEEVEAKFRAVGGGLRQCTLFNHEAKGDPDDPYDEPDTLTLLPVNETQTDGPDQRRKVQVWLASSSMNLAQLAGIARTADKSGTRQYCFGDFNGTTKIKITGTWEETECETEDYERTYDGE